MIEITIVYTHGVMIHLTECDVLSLPAVLDNMVDFPWCKEVRFTLPEDA